MGLPCLLFALVALLFHTSAVPPPEEKCGDRRGYCRPKRIEACANDDILQLPCPLDTETCCRLPPPEKKCGDRRGYCRPKRIEACAIDDILQLPCSRDNEICCRLPPPEEKCGDRRGYCRPKRIEACDNDDILQLPCSRDNEICCRLPPQRRCEELGGICMKIPDDTCVSSISAKCDGEDTKCCKKE